MPISVFFLSSPGTMTHFLSCPRVDSPAPDRAMFLLWWHTASVTSSARRPLARPFMFSPQFFTLVLLATFSYIESCRCFHYHDVGGRVPSIRDFRFLHDETSQFEICQTRKAAGRAHQCVAAPPERVSRNKNKQPFFFKLTLNSFPFRFCTVVSVASMVPPLPPAPSGEEECAICYPRYQGRQATAVDFEVGDRSARGRSSLLTSM